MSQVTAAAPSGTIPIFQVFDGSISASAALADARRYQAVWGAAPSLAPVWRRGNAAILPLYYVVQETDPSYNAWGSIGHDLLWWQQNHPDWILYACTAGGTPTATPAYIGQLPTNMPLDFHNLAAVDYQIRAEATYAYQHGYGGLGADEVQLYNVSGSGVGTGYYGCGIREGAKFVRRYASPSDPAWASDTISWLKEARRLLTTDKVLAPYHLKLYINHPAENPSSTQEQALLANLDGVVNETGFTDYGLYQEPSRANEFYVTALWMSYAQQHNITTLTVDKLGVTPVTSDQLEYSIATFLLANNGKSALFVADQYGYGYEQYHPEYGIGYGTPCAAFYGGASYDAQNPQMYYRRYTNAFVAVNSGSLPRASEIAKLPAGHAFRDVEGRRLTTPLSVGSNDAYVLLTTNGCN